jgi:preprotein translocase subunit SecE
VAIRKRRGDDAVDERLDEALDDDAPAQDDLVEDDRLDEEDLLEEDEEDLLDEDELVDEDEEVEESARKRGRRGTATKPDTVARGKKTGPGRKSKVREADRPNIFGRLINFVREIVAELRKVIWPTRKELLTYTAVVIVFVTIVTSTVAALDYGFAKLVLVVFGNGKTK